MDNIESSLRERVEKLNLKKEAMNIIHSSLNASIESDKEVDIDFLKGFSKDELIFEFDRFEFQLASENGCRIITRIGIYVNDTFGIYNNNLNPIGYYEFITDLDGEIMDDYMTIEKEKTRLNNR